MKIWPVPVLTPLPGLVRVGRGGHQGGCGGRDGEAGGHQTNRVHVLSSSQPAPRVWGRSPTDHAPRGPGMRHTPRVTGLVKAGPRLDASIGNNGARDPRHLAPRGRDRRGLARPQLPPRRDVVRGVHQLRGARAAGHRRVGVPVRRRRRRDRAPAHRAVAGDLARRAAGRLPRHPLRLPGRRPLGAAGGTALQPGQAAARPLRPRGLRPGHRGQGDLRPRPGRPGRARRHRLRAVRAARGGRPRRLRLGRRRADAAPLPRHRDLRDARQGHDRAARPGARGAARDVRRAGVAGGDRLPARPRRHRGGAAARAPVHDRAGGGGPRPGELLGLQHARLLRAAQRLRLRRATAASR